MLEQDSKGISYTGGFFMLIAFAFGSLILAYLLSIPVWTSLTGKSIDAWMDGNISGEDKNAMRLIQLITAVIGFFLPAVLTASILNRRPMNLLGFQGKISWKQAGLIFAIVVAALFVSGFFGWVNDIIPISDEWRARFQRMEDDYNKQVVAIIALDSPIDFLVALVIMAFLPALCEETLFRGGFQNFLTRATRIPWLSIGIVSIMFSLLHFSYFGFLPRLALGIMLGVVYHCSGRLWLCILAHFLNNALALTVMYAYKLQGKTLEEALKEATPTWVGIFAVPVLVFLLYIFYKASYRKNAKPAQFTFEQNPGNPSDGI